MKKLSFALLPTVLTAGPALAHVDPATHGSLAAGMTHPLMGADHLAAMVCVGLWAAVMGGRSMLALPAAFVAAMAVGFGLALFGSALPLVEPAILASIMALGVLVALSVRLSAVAGAALVAGFGLFHGFAHGAELGGAGALGFLGGFVAATAALHLAGVGLGLVLTRVAPGLALRTAGAGVAAFGALLAVAG
ncbi:HupE/UreJ family protein [Mesobacterium sp. TK19101]|uniref:HupE/UreJ family protein n=1 Tax=Mesobacterium hydrothermale TaxID=3111907 RepID=A0ABU6HGN9_9RHOB|nr:HupE/UreJ family protein [Mesobacterium sp. TK19101]MEC3861010.1 HupE/UreJ family protein [Mesobacterium sp. TK19101]